MAKAAQILRPFMKLPSNERAAALAHWIYVQTTQRGENRWNLRVAESWDSLDSEPKHFNVLTIDTWLEHPEVLDAWIAAVRACKKERAGTRPKRKAGSRTAKRAGPAKVSARRSRKR
jgi:hypothetical protein